MDDEKKEEVEDKVVVCSQAAMYYRTHQYEKAIIRYTKALELMPDDKKCLLARSKCYLALGNTAKALVDASKCVDQDKTCYKGVLQKAEVLYYQGDFERALVFYQRGAKLRPNLPEFRLGIQKAQDAINNSVDTPQKVMLNTTGDLSFFDDQDTNQKKRPEVSSTGQPMAAKKDLVTREATRSVAYNKAIRQLLKDLYADKQWLETFLKETDVRKEAGKMVYDTAEEGLRFLDTRTDFWHQQKPMYARRYDSMMLRKQFPNTKTGSDEYIIRGLEKIDEAQTKGKYQEALKRAMQCLDTLDVFTDNQVTNKLTLKAQLYSCIGNAYLEMGQYDKALSNHLVDYNIGEANNMEDAMSRGLDNLGRVYARKGNYLQAIKVWEAKLPISKMPLETTWLCHEIGRCYFELHMYPNAKDYGQQSLAAALEAEDITWQLHGCVLIAQSEVKLEEYESAYSNFNKSLELAAILHDRAAESAIKKAITEVRSRLAAAVRLHEDVQEAIRIFVSRSRTESTPEPSSTPTPGPSIDATTGGERPDAQNDVEL